jgi:hypothetical protein
VARCVPGPVLANRPILHVRSVPNARGSNGAESCATHLRTDAYDHFARDGHEGADRVSASRLQHISQILQVFEGAPLLPTRFVAFKEERLADQSRNRGAAGAGVPDI